MDAVEEAKAAEQKILEPIESSDFLKVPNSHRTDKSASVADQSDTGTVFNKLDSNTSGIVSKLDSSGVSVAKMMVDEDSSDEM